MCLVLSKLNNSWSLDFFVPAVQKVPQSWTTASTFRSSANRTNLALWTHYRHVTSVNHRSRVCLASDPMSVQSITCFPEEVKLCSCVCSSSWDEHVFELVLPKACMVGHVDLKFVLNPNTINIPQIQVTLLKNKAPGLGKVTGEDIHSV